MLDLDTRQVSTAMAAANAVVDPIVGGKAIKPLSPAALKVAAQPIASLWSPIVVAGVVRMVEFTLTVAVGFVIYGIYVVPVDGFEWHYVAAIFGIATLVYPAYRAHPSASASASARPSPVGAMVNSSTPLCSSAAPGG